LAIAGILTFYGLLIAAYSILKKHEKLLIMLRLSLLDKILFPILMIGTFFCILVSDYFRDFPRQTFLLGQKFEYSFLILSATFVMVFLLFVYLGIKIKVNRLSRRKIKLFRNLTVELLNKKEFSVLIALLSEEYKRLIKYANSLSLKNSIKNGLLKYFELKPSIELQKEMIRTLQKYYELRGKESDIENIKQPKVGKVKSISRNVIVEFRHFGGKIIRGYYQEVNDKSQSVARDLLNLLLTSREFIPKLIEFKVELGLKILNYKFQVRPDFADIFFYELIRNKGSILYYEIKNNQNIFLNRYFINEENRIITYLFKNCKVAQNLDVYRGIGDYVRDYLEDLNKLKNDPYNYGYENFKETRWDSPIFVGIRFFDIMVSECIHQGIRWHMWLFYFRIFTERILINFQVIPSVWDEYREWNSKYAYLLYEIVSTLCNWIEIIESPEFTYKVELRNDNFDHENGNIIKSSIICLIQVLDAIADADVVPDRFKEYLMDIVFRLLFDMRKMGSSDCIKYSNVLFSCIEHHLKRFPKVKVKFYTLIKSAYRKFDKIPYVLERENELTKELDSEIEQLLSEIASSL
jgi:hypothetical protein